MYIDVFCIELPAMSHQLPRLISLRCPCRSRNRGSSGTQFNELKTFTDDGDWEVVADDKNFRAAVSTTKARPEDPRADPSSWPCFGKHAPRNCGNQHGSWIKCTRCGVRLSYQKTTTSARCNFDLIADAMARLQKLHKSEEVTSAMVEDMIKHLRRSPAATPAATRISTMGRSCKNVNTESKSSSSALDY